MSELRARLDDSDAARDDLQLRLSRGEAALRQLRAQAEELATDKQVPSPPSSPESWTAGLQHRLWGVDGLVCTCARSGLMFSRPSLRGNPV